MIVFINKIDDVDDTSCVTLVKEDVCELINRFKPDCKISIVLGSASNALKSINAGNLNANDVTCIAQIINILSTLD